MDGRPRYDTILSIEIENIYYLDLATLFIQCVGVKLCICGPLLWDQVHVCDDCALDSYLKHAKSE